VHVLATEAAAGAVGVAKDLRIHPSTPFYECATAGVIATIVPGCFYQQSSQMTVAGLGDSSLATFWS
jgi:hypothetical protein